MKFNPTKCTYKISTEKFLRFGITRRNIEAFPIQIKEIQNMHSPHNVQKIQKLNGWIVADVIMDADKNGVEESIQVLVGQITRVGDDLIQRIQHEGLSLCKKEYHRLISIIKMASTHIKFVPAQGKLALIKTISDLKHLMEIAHLNGEH